MIRWWVWIGVALLAACTTSPQAPDAEGWRAVALPGKTHTRYAWVVKDGRQVLSAHADRSASMWRRPMAVPAKQLGSVSFSWWVDAPLSGADLTAQGQGDAPARILFAFAGDHARLSTRNRMLFDLAETLSGERPPYATLMYVYGPEGAQAEDLVIHPRTDRVRKIVLDAGLAHARQWRLHRRDLAADYRRAFGEEPGALVSVAVMTDADNTQQQARAWYGPIEHTP